MQFEARNVGRAQEIDNAYRSRINTLQSMRFEAIQSELER